MGSVTVDGNAYDVYGDLADATLYLAGGVTPGAVAWRALSSNEKQRRILAARILLDRQPWAGDAVNGPLPALQWPRTGVTYADGTPVSSATVPQEVVWAEYELAAVMAASGDAYGALNSGSNIERVKAGPVEVEFFTGTNGQATPLPKVAWDYVGQFMASAGAAAVGKVSGACGESHFDSSGCVTPYSRFGPF
jgi:hypothetical protein